MVALSHEAKTNLDKLMNDAVEQGKIPGVVFAAATVEQTLYHNEVGYNTIEGPPSGKLDENSVFWICSMTKLVITLAALQLVEQGKITLDSEIHDVLPELKDPVAVDDLLGNQPTYWPADNQFLFKHLLNHTSGMSYAERKPHPDFLSAGYTKEEYYDDHSQIQFFRILRRAYPAIPVEFEPGSNWVYGWNCDVLVIIIERLHNTTIEEYCRKHIFEPLGIKMTFFLTPEWKERLVPLTFRNKNGDLELWRRQLPIIEQDPKEIKQCLGGIGLYSTMKDYLIMLQHILSIQAGRINTGIVSASTVNSLFKPTLPPDVSPAVDAFLGYKNCNFGYGLCVNETDWEGARRKGSGFWYGWAGTYYFMDPTTGIAVVYGTQVVPTRDRAVEELWEKLEKALYSGLKVA